MSFEKLFKLVFWFGCFICTFCVSAILIFNYAKNESSSVLRIIKFNRSDDRNYPALTMCFYSAKEKTGLYLEDFIGRKLRNERDILPKYLIRHCREQPF